VSKVRSSLNSRGKLFHVVETRSIAPDEVKRGGELIEVFAV